MIEFADRVEAGRRLAERLEYLRGQDVVVLGLPRGGVPVAFEVAQALNAPFDVIVVRKLGVPVQRELAMGAIGEGGARVLEAEVLRQTYVTEEQLRAVETRERALLEARVARLRSGRVARRAAGPGWATAWRGAGPHTADCGQRRPGCSRAEPAGTSPAALSERAGGRRGGHAPVRRAGHAGGGGAPDERLVRPLPFAGRRRAAGGRAGMSPICRANERRGRVPTSQARQ